MTTQLDLLQSIPGPRDHVTAEDQERLRGLLLTAGWQTRREICAALSWDERKLRAVAESLGAEIVRCQLGYKLTQQLSRDDIPHAVQACDAFESQARKNLAYSTDLRRRLHAIIH